MEQVAVEGINEDTLEMSRSFLSSSMSSTMGDSEGQGVETPPL